MLLCHNCPRNCNKIPFCSRTEDHLRINVYQAHYGEEPLISGTKGSGTIFFANCNMKCVFCQNYKISQEAAGKDVNSQNLYNICKELESMGVHNINFVTPTPYADKIIPVMKKLKQEGFKLPFVWNCGGYENIKGVKELKGLVDIYLPDFKYSDNKLAVRYSCAPSYFDNFKQVLCEMRSQVNDVINEANGVMEQGLIIRHLVLPGNVQNSIGVLKAIKDLIGVDVYISLMSQYCPLHKAGLYNELSRRLNNEEYQLVCDSFYELGFHKGFLQDLSSATEEHIPDFFA